MKKILITLAVSIFSGCSSQNESIGISSELQTRNSSNGTLEVVDTLTEDIESNRAYEKIISDYNWANCDGELLKMGVLTEKMIGPLFFLTLVDINMDGVTEIIKSHKYSSRTTQMNEIYAIRQNEIKYVGCFWGGLEDLKYYMDSHTGDRIFNCYSEVYQQQTTTKIIYECRFNSNLSKFSWKPLFTEIEDSKGMLYYGKCLEDQYKASTFSCWDFSMDKAEYMEKNLTMYPSEKEYSEAISEYYEQLQYLDTIIYESSENLVGIFGSDESDIPLPFSTQEEIRKVVHDLCEKFYI